MLDYRTIDADNHYYETRDAFSRHIESRFAERTFLAARRGAHVIPKYLFGRPLDQIVTSARVPFFVRRALGRGIYRLAVGDMTRYGLPRPDHELGQAHPTISGRILDRLTHGAITVKPNIASLEGETVKFVDGTEAHADIVVYCTGYKITFPFLDADVISAEDNRVRLYKRMLHPDHRGLYFPGLIQPLGAIMPVAERQGVLIGEDLRGHYEPPSQADMEADVDEHEARMKKRYVASKRHTIQVDQEAYMREVAKEIEAGRKRVLEGAGV